MQRVNTYLNFQGQTEEAFAFYATVFNPGYDYPVWRFGDTPDDPETATLSDDDRNKVMHTELPIMNGHVIMGTDMLESVGQHIRVGNNTTISLEFDSRDEALRVYSALSEGGSEATGMNDMPWGAYWGCCLDRFEIRWMFSFMESPMVP